MPDGTEAATEQDRIIRTLADVERRLRRNRLARDLVAGFTISLAVPLGLTVWHRFSPLRSSIVLAGLAVWIAGLAAYAGWKLTGRGTLAGAAAAVDRKAGLHDELTTAYWFHRRGLVSGWIDLQRRRAARTADALAIGWLFPFTVPPGSRRTVALLALIIVLNVMPLSWTRGWLRPGRPPMVELSEADRMQLDEIRRLLEEATALQGAGLPVQAGNLLTELEQPQLSRHEAVGRLRELQALLDELSAGPDAESIDRLVENLADAFDTAASTEPAADALRRHDLDAAADALRTAAEQLASSDSDMQSLETSLDGLSEQAQAALQQLASDLADAGEQLRAEGGDARRAFDRLAGDLERIARGRRSQQLREAAARGLAQLDAALRQRAGEPGQAPPPSRETAPAEGRLAAAPQAGGMPATRSSLAVEGPETGVPTAERGRGELSAPGSGDAIQYGALTHVEVELRPEVLELPSRSRDDPDGALGDRPSQASRSQLPYEPVEPDLRYAEPERLDADRIPWAYRHLVKRYFRAVGPRGTHDH